MKRLICVLLVLFIPLLALAGCGTGKTDGTPASGGESGNSESTAADETGSPAKKEPVEIDFLHHLTGVNAQLMQELVKKYNESQDGILVKEYSSSGNDYAVQLEKYQTLAAVEKQPSVSIVGLPFTEYMINSMPIVPIQDFIDKDQFDTSDFYPTMLELGEDSSGRLWMVPFGVSTPVVYYNRSIFKNAGLDPENPPRTFDELREAAKKIAALGIQGCYVGGIADTQGWVYQSLVESNGGKMLSEDKKSMALNNDAGLKALHFVTDMVFVDKSMNYDPTQASQLFLAGKTGMLFGSCAGTKNMITQNPDISVAPFPSDGVHPKQVAGGGCCISISKATPEKEAAAWEFVKYMTSPEAVATISENIGWMSTRKSVVEKEELLGKFLKEEPRAAVPYEQMNDMVRWQNYPGESGTRITQIIQDKMQAVLTGQLSPEAALGDIEKEANKLLKE